MPQDKHGKRDEERIYCVCKKSKLGQTPPEGFMAPVWQVAATLLNVFHYMTFSFDTFLIQQY